jgi:hypothetical protein
LQFEMVLNNGVSPLWNSLNGKARPGLVAPILPWTAPVRHQSGDMVAL